MMDYGYSEKGQQASLGDFHLWQRIFRFTGPYWLGLGCAVLISFLITWATLTLPYLVQTAIDNHITASQLSAEERLTGLARTAVSYGILPDPDSRMGGPVGDAYRSAASFPSPVTARSAVFQQQSDRQAGHQVDQRYPEHE
jgi:hypothetical protein